MGGSSYIPSWSREQHNSSLGNYNLYDSRSSRKQINSQSRKINELNGTIEDQKVILKRLDYRNHGFIEIVISKVIVL